jgi:hypothetical protein
VSATSPVDRYTAALVDVFKRAPSKHEAHARSHAVMQDLIGDRTLLTEMLERYLRDPEALNRLNYPVVALEGPLNEYFGLVLNCWIPLPDRRTEVSTKAIHHHGDMLLTTGTLLGPGYLHWTFTRPQLVDAGRELFAFDVAAEEQHPAGHVAFVDDHVPHLPWYPADLSITACLWSSRHPTTWKDRVKRIQLLKRNEETLRRLAKLARLDRLAARTFDLKVIEYFDFYPTPDGLKGMRVRDEYQRGPNVDHLHSLFHVLQRTGHEALAPRIRAHLAAGRIRDRATVTQLLSDLEHGRAIAGKLSACHLDLPHTTFTPTAVASAIARMRPAAADAASAS